MTLHFMSKRDLFRWRAHIEKPVSFQVDFISRSRQFMQRHKYPSRNRHSESFGKNSSTAKRSYRMMGILNLIGITIITLSRGSKVIPKAFCMNMYVSVLILWMVAINAEYFCLLRIPGTGRNITNAYARISNSGIPALNWCLFQRKDPRKSFPP